VVKVCRDSLSLFLPLGYHREQCGQTYGVDLFYDSFFNVSTHHGSPLGFLKAGLGIFGSLEAIGCGPRIPFPGFTPFPGAQNLHVTPKFVC